MLPHSPIPHRYNTRYYYHDYIPEGVSAPERVALLASRIETQEKRSEQLMDRATRVHQELVENLTYQQGSWQEERQSRELLGEHIRTITAVIRENTAELNQLEASVKDRGQAIITNDQVLKKLQGHHIVAITDLRGRVGRCDGTLAKVAKETRSTSDAISKLIADFQTKRSKITENMQMTEDRVTEFSGRRDRAGMDSKASIKQMEEALTHLLYNLESRARTQREDIDQAVYSYVTHAKAEMESMQTRMDAHIDSIATEMDKRTETLFSKQRELVRTTLERLNNLEKDHAEYSYHVTQMYQILEQTMKDYADQIHRDLSTQLKRVRAEMRDGLSAIHESVVTMRSLVEGRQALVEETMCQEMAGVRKKVVLI